MSNLLPLDDLACVGCQYNLRGLNASGRCPECGMAVADTLSVQASTFRPDLSRTSAAARRRWTAGLTCVLAGSAATAVVAALPEAWLQPHTPPWPVVLSTAVVGWVATLYGVWLTSTWDERLFAPGTRPVTWLWAAGCVLVACQPAAVGLDRMDRHRLWPAAVGLCALSASVLAAAFHARLARLATAAGRPVMSTQFVVLAAVVLLWSCVSFAAVAANDGGSSLLVLFAAPNPACGSVAIPVFAFRYALRWDWPLLLAAAPVWPLKLIAGLLTRLLKPAGAGRSTDASFPP